MGLNTASIPLSSQSLSDKDRFEMGMARITRPDPSLSITVSSDPLALTGFTLSVEFMVGSGVGIASEPGPF
jgi:hypothetical protein